MSAIYNPGNPWPHDDVIGAAMEFEASFWYPLALIYVPPGQKFSRAIRITGEQFRAQFGTPAVALVREIPAGAEEFDEIDGITLVQADWVQERFVVMGYGGCQVTKKGFERWKKVSA